jgi:branched-chain amino acid transport system permease protein
MTYILHLIIMFDIFVILSVSLNFLTGYLGLFSLSHAFFYGIGAYAAGLSMLKLDCSLPTALILAAGAGSGMGYIISLLTYKARRDDFILITLSIQMIGFSLLMNWTGLTNGPFGISGIPRTIFGTVSLSENWLFIIATSIMITVLTISTIIQSSPFGLTLKSIREDELAASTLCIDANKYIQKTMILSGLMSAIAGALYAVYATFIDPTSFSVNESMLFVMILIIGGSGNIKGPVIGALIITLLPEMLRAFNLNFANAAEIRQVLFGVAIVVLMRIRPQGLGGTYNLK